MKNDNIKENAFAFLRLIIFLGIFISIFFILENVLHENSFEHPTWSYVTSPNNEPIDILFVGNSHTYTSIDAEVISMATDLNVRSLTCASINGKVVAADIEAFLNYSVPEVIVIEMCPFSVNYLDDNEKTKIGLVYEHFDAIPNIYTHAKALSQVTALENIPTGTFQLLRNTSMWTRWQKTELDLQGYDSYGSNKKYSVYWNTDYDATQIREQTMNYVPNEISECMNTEDRQAFNKILELSEAYGFEVWIYTAPLASFDSAYEDSLNYISSIKSYYPSIKYIDNSMLYLDEIGICRTDFYDDTHLNPNGMQKTTLWMINKIAMRFNVEADTSNILRYYNSEVTLIEEDLFRYEVNSYGNAMYQFSYVDSNGNLITTDWSNNNWFEETYIPTNKITVNVASSNMDNSEIITYKFLPYTLRGYTANINSDGQLELINNCNFSDNINFAWYLTNNNDGTIVKYNYSDSNNIILNLEKSGSYTISAFVKQVDSNARISDNILTLQYDENTKEITVIQQVDFITVNEN